MNILTQVSIISGIMILSAGLLILHLQMKYSDLIKIANHRAKLLDQQDAQIQEYKDALLKYLSPAELTIDDRIKRVDLIITDKHFIEPDKLLTDNQAAAFTLFREYPSFPRYNENSDITDLKGQFYYHIYYQKARQLGVSPQIAGAHIKISFLYLADAARAKALLTEKSISYGVLNPTTIIIDHPISFTGFTAPADIS